MAEKKCHLLCRFVNGEKAHGEDGDPDVYFSECCRCNRFVAVSFADGRDNVRIYGSAIDRGCEP
jgi:hypothetical protein